MMSVHLSLLGFKVRDVVTQFEGVVESISFELYGCVQAIVRPERDKKKPNDLPDGRWFDVKRLVAISRSPVMTVPSYEDAPGGAEKPPRPSRPAR